MKNSLKTSIVADYPVELALADAEAKTPQALALAIARYSAIFRNGDLFMAHPELLMNLHRTMMHENLLEHAGIKSEAIYGPAMTHLWVCPEVIIGLSDLAAMKADEHIAIAQACRDSDPALRVAVFTNLDGSATKDLAKVLREWSAHSLVLFQKGMPDPSLLDGVRCLFAGREGFSGATSLVEFDHRIEGAVSAMGIDHPAEIEDLLLRITGIVDVETADLGQDAGVDVKGVAYALVLAHLACREGLEVGLEVPDVSLQEAYGVMQECRMMSRADLLANGAPRACEYISAGSAQLTVHRPEAVQAIAAALCGVMQREDGFAAVAAAADFLSDGQLCGLIDVKAGNSAAVAGFSLACRHDEDVMREVLSEQLYDVMPPLYIGDDRKIETDPEVVSETLSRLTEALRIVHPEARAISLMERHSELIARLSQL